MAKICQHFLISGHVQGVYFRQSTKQKAKQLGITGWVKNLPDGRVEVVACGSCEVMQTFASWLWQGPIAAQVREVIINEIAQEEFSNFDIR